MRHVLILFLLPLCLISCSGGSANETAAAAKDSVTAAPAAAVSYPYTADYSSNFSPGKESDVATTLANYKAWENNDMKALRATLADSSTIIFSSGFVLSGTSDSLVKLATKYRDSLSKVEIMIRAWIASHSNDKNEDWVNVWYKETDYYKTGKVDSTEYEDANRLKDGKIIWTTSYAQKKPKK
jgi:ketosteroid isomerase-like protein